MDRPHDAETREVVTCAKCGLVQFVTSTGACRRCKHLPEPPPPVVEIDLPSEDRERPREAKCRIRLPIGRVRRSRGMTQTQVAQKLGCPRTYISKLENFGTTPTLTNLLKIADVLEVPIISLLGEDPRPRSYGQDAFLSEMATQVLFLNADQRQFVLNSMHALLRKQQAMLRKQRRRVLRNQKTEQRETEQTQ